MLDSPIDVFCSRLAAGDHSAIRSLLASGTDVNVCGTTGRTPLSLAASEGLSAIILELLENGAMSMCRAITVGRHCTKRRRTGTSTPFVSCFASRQM